MISPSACRPWQPDRAANPAQHCRSYTTAWGTIDEDELKLLARTLAFGQATDTLDGLREYLDAVFGLVGLRRIPANESAFPYDDAIFQWMAQGRLEFDRSTFPAICRREGLIGQAGGQPRIYGVKSFEHPIDRLEERCFRVLDVIPAFDERYIRSDADWQVYALSGAPRLLAGRRQGSVPSAARPRHARHPRIRGGLDPERQVRPSSRARTTHARPAHLGGRRQAAEPGLADRHGRGEGRWCPGGQEVAVVVGLTHQIADEVERYVESNLPSVGKLLLFSLSGGVGATSVVCGRHADELAESICRPNPGYGHAASGNESPLCSCAQRLHVLFGTASGCDGPHPVV